MKTAKNWIRMCGICVLLGMALLLCGCDAEVSEEKENLSTPEEIHFTEEDFFTDDGMVVKVKVHDYDGEEWKMLTGEEMEQFIDAMIPIAVGTNPVSAKGYTDLKFGCTFYFDNEERENEKDPLLLNFAASETEVYLHYGRYQEADDGRFLARYQLNASKEELKDLFRPYFPRLNTRTFPVEETVDFSTMDFSNTSHIELFRGWDAQTIVVEDEAEIETILSAIQKVSGTDPISVRGYYGTSYICKIYQEGEETPTRIGFWSGTGTGTEMGSFDYGLYEQVVNHQYAAMYTMTGISDQDLFAILDPFFDTNNAN